MRPTSPVRSRPPLDDAQLGRTTSTEGIHHADGQGDAASTTASHAILIIAQLTVVSFMSSFSTGMITVCIPAMANELSLSPQTYFWPLSVYGVTCTACLLIAGAVADVTGSRPVYLVGVFLVSCFMSGSGLARTGIELIVFRAMQGIAMALTLPTSVGILTGSVVAGRLRNVGFAFTILGQPLGFSAGSVLGGVFAATVGWRVGWYVCAATTFVVFFGAVWAIPEVNLERPPSLSRLRTDIDWVGATMAGASLGMLAYALVQISSRSSYISNASVVALLVIGLALVPAFALWMRRQEALNRPALIPNSLWKCLQFTSVCVMILLSYATMQTMELFCSLFFQNVQGLSALQASLRLLPSMILGAVLNLTAGLIVDRAPVFYITLVSSALCAGAPLLMALIDPSWPYWYAAFPAQILEPLSVDVLSIVGLIVVSEVFPEGTQALAGAVFNTAGQLGMSLGLALISVVSDSVTRKSALRDKASPGALEIGYRAGFWTSFAFVVLTCVLGVGGLRNVGRIGLKRD